MKHAVIYIPGLGDGRLTGQRLLTASWWLWGVRPVVVPMRWDEGTTFAPKLDRLLHAIDNWAARGYRVSLVGASAGAGAVLNAFAERKATVSGVVCIAGKVNRPEAIGSAYRLKSPAFVESAFAVQSSLDALDFDADRPRVQSRYALLDFIIPREDSEVAGGQNKSVASIGHAVTIGTQLLFGAPFFIARLRQLAKKNE